MIGDKFEIDQFRVDPGGNVTLANFDPQWMGSSQMQKLGQDDLKKDAKNFLKERRKELSQAQEVLYANNRYSLLIIFQGRDAAGKDSTIKHVMRGVNPQGCQVFSFKKPSEEELDHNYLWRCWKALPERGRIGIFNRSYYEEVLVVRVHPEILATQRLPEETLTDEIWKQRFEDINNFELHMARNGTIILKFFLNVSKEEQKRRFIERLNNPEKQWKFSAFDLEVREYWDKYTKIVEDMLAGTSTEVAPWYVIPSDHKWIARALVGEIITNRIGKLDMALPEPDEKMRGVMKVALEQLQNEP